MAAGTSEMKVSVETVAGLERRMTVQVPSADIEREIAARLAKVGRTARLKGFRPGKAPPKVVRQYYGGQVRDEVVSEIVRSTYSRAIAEQKLNPAGGPRIEPLGPPLGTVGTGQGEGESFSYRATFEVFPEIALSPVEQLSIRRPKVEIADGDVDAMIEKLRAQRATWRAVERPAQAGDRAVIDFVGRIDGETFDGGSGTDAPVVVGGGQVLPEFDAALVGVAPGNATQATVKFPDDYHGAAVAGKTAEFAITVKRVEERELPAVDGDFAAAFGVPDGGLPELRQQVRANMQRELAERLRGEINRRVFDALAAANAVTVPRTLVEDEIDNLVRSAMRRMGVQDPAQAPPREPFRAGAEKRVALSLLVQELVRQHSIQPDRRRVEQRVQELAAPYEKPEEAAQYYRGDRGMMAQIEAWVFEDQVAELILERARTSDESVAFRDFMGA